MTDRELMQMALDALLRVWHSERNIKHSGTIDALRARLSAPEPEEKKYTEESCPVCGYYCLGKGGVYCIDKPKLCGINTTPPQREWVGLTDEEIGNVIEASQITLKNYCSEDKQTEYARAIESKLREKNATASPS